MSTILVVPFLYVGEWVDGKWNPEPTNPDDINCLPPQTIRHMWRVMTKIEDLWKSRITYVSGKTQTPKVVGFYLAGERFFIEEVKPGILSVTSNDKETRYKFRIDFNGGPKLIAGATFIVENFFKFCSLFSFPPTF